MPSLPWLYLIKKLVTNEKVRDWCLLPYPGHPKGCPNYAVAAKCPPSAPHVSDYFDLSRDLWLVHSEFDLLGHMQRMKAKHSSWSDRQLKCVLYWQPTSRKELKFRRMIASINTGANQWTDIPEAMGVNVYATAALAGLRLQKIKRLSTCRHIALIGFSKQGQESLF